MLQERQQTQEQGSLNYLTEHVCVSVHVHVSVRVSVYVCVAVAVAVDVVALAKLHLSARQAARASSTVHALHRLMRLQVYLRAGTHQQQYPSDPAKTNKQ